MTVDTVNQISRPLVKRIGAGRRHLVHFLAVLLAPLGDLLVAGRQMRLRLLLVMVHRTSPFAGPTRAAPERLPADRVEAP